MLIFVLATETIAIKPLILEQGNVINVLLKKKYSNVKTLMMKETKLLVMDIELSYLTVCIFTVITKYQHFRCIS